MTLGIGLYAPCLMLVSLLGMNPIAAFVVKSLPLQWLYWLVVVVVLYAAILMLRSALHPGEHPERLPPSDAIETPRP